MNPSQNAHFDSGFGSSINQPSGSFGEGYPGQLLVDNYESENEYDLSLDINDFESGPISLQPASLQLHTTIFDNTSLHVSSNVQNNDSNSTGTHSSETGLTSTVACTSTANTACTGVNVDLSTSSSDNIDNFPSDPDHIHGRVVANIQDENSGLDTEQSRQNSPSPVLSHVRAEPIKVKEIIIRTPVVERRPEVISERILIEGAHSPP